MRVYDIIMKKRDNNELSKEEIKFFIDEYTNDSIHDYHAAALLMAIFLNKMNERETIDLTEAIMHSGETIDLSNIMGVKVDKHSTGGVGDTTSLVLAPLVASLGIKFAKMSGRGLGHTGGTIDKLESIKGFRTSLSIEEFTNNVNNINVAIIGQTKNIAPADKKLYSLRDVTATVDNLSLIASSIMSKKLAAGSDAIVLDVKVGSGAFVKNYDDAVELASLMVKIGEGMGRRTMAVISEMAQPLGNAIGNAIEVIEAVDILKNNGPGDLRELCLTLGANLVVMAKKANTFEDAYKLLEKQLVNGEALEYFKKFISAQGGEIDFINNYDLLPKASIVKEIYPPKNGYIKTIESDEVGIASLLLGAGRENLEDKIDHGAGIYLIKKIGDYVHTDEPMAIFYTNDENSLSDAENRFYPAFEYCDEEIVHPKLIKAIISKDGINKL
ncbi:MAG: pyrimidine-nucleoside phosphorylase [Clostridiales bacterium]|nr:pyrimidine-nucleoside phosphorylase [Clostridiales bacterium]